MALIAPFRGVRFNPKKIRDLNEVVSPPYDVINDEDGEALVRKNPYNMIQLDLRNDPNAAGDSGGARYREARDRFDSWQSDQVLIRDEEPAIYLYFIDYTHPSGRRLVRKGLVALVGLSEFSEGVVRPHEQTFDTVITDRLNLMNHCEAQFSQVFSIYSDPEARVMSVLEAAREPEPVCAATDRDGNTHTVWRVTDPAALRDACRFFKDRPVYIADGHHRYTTALGCRARAMAAHGGSLPPDSPFNFIMMYLCGIEDQGLSVLPTHRLVNYPGRLELAGMLERFREGMEVEEIREGSRESLVAEALARMDELDEPLRRQGRAVFGLYHPGEDRCFILRLPPETVDLVPRQGAGELRRLDVVILSEVVIARFLGLDHERCSREHLIGYYSDPDEALDTAVKRSVTEEGVTPLLFLLNPTRVRQVTAVADAGGIMPHKSTYFYPKVMTGLLLNKLVEDEHIPLCEEE